MKPPIRRTWESTLDAFTKLCEHEGVNPDFIAAMRKDIALDRSNLEYSWMHSQAAKRSKVAWTLHHKVCPPNCRPFCRLLSWHARLTLDLRPQTVDARRLTTSYDNSLGRTVFLYKYSLTVDPLHDTPRHLADQHSQHPRQPLGLVVFTVLLRFLLSFEFN